MAKSKLIARHYSCPLVKCTLCTLCTSFYLFAHFTLFLQCVFVSLHNICIVFLSELLSFFVFCSAVFSTLFSDFFNFSTKMIKGQQVNQRFFQIKDFMEQKLWLIQSVYSVFNIYISRVQCRQWPDPGLSPDAVGRHKMQAGRLPVMHPVADLDHFLCSSSISAPAPLLLLQFLFSFRPSSNSSTSS